MTKAVAIKRDPIPYKIIIDDLNKVTGRVKGNEVFTLVDSTKKMIRTRWNELVGMEPNVRLACFAWVHRVKFQEWEDTEFGKYLQPKTLYCKSHFHNYRVQRAKKTVAPARIKKDQEECRKFLES